MLRFLGAQVRFRAGRVAALALGIVVAAVAFVLLTAATRTSEIRVRGTLESNYRAAYDVLVRPRDSKTPLERSEGLVRPNFLSGIYGGISVRQYEEIKKIQNVAVAAPIANIGYVLPFSLVPIRLNDVVTDAPRQLYRVKTTYVANGLSRYRATENYVYYTPRYRFVDRNHIAEIVPGGSSPLPVCSGFEASYQGQYGPFAHFSSLGCFSARAPALSSRYFGRSFAPPGWIGSELAGFFPVFLAAIDPEQEARLVHLDDTLVSGRYLRQSESARLVPSPDRSFMRTAVPVIASGRNYVGDKVDVAIERLTTPEGIDVPRALASGACVKAVLPCPERIAPPKGASYRNAFDFVRGLSGQVVARRRYTFAVIYQHLLGEHLLPFGSYWSTSPVRYRALGPDRLEAIPAHNPISVWRDPTYPDAGGFFPAPPDNKDVQFRRLHAHVLSGKILEGEIVGRFDPERLPGFSELSAVPLETYYPPALTAADATSRRAMRGQRFLPTQNVGGYVAQPPLLLTTLEGLKTFLDPKIFTGLTQRQQRAPISAVRVRVAGVKGPDPLSRERIRAVAEQIHEKTGLGVDITSGSSPHPVAIRLPAGRFGQPSLLLEEGWSKKGVSVSFLEALDRKDLALFSLTLVICAVFLANGAFAAIRGRRAEIGSLLTLGWSPGEIFAAVLGELALVGLLAGLVGMLFAAALVELFSLDFSIANTLYVLPLALGLALVAGLAPAWQAARGLPLDAIRPVVAGKTHSGNVRGLVHLALVNVRRLPARTLAGGAGLTIGAAALTVLVAIQNAFQGTLIGTLLGNAVSLQVRTADFVAAGLTLALAALTVADVLYLNLKERSSELVTLRTLGWSEADVVLLVEIEALTLGLAASVAGGALGVVLGSLLLGVPVISLIVASGIAIGVGTLAALAASLFPVSQIGRLTPPAVLAAE